MHTHWSTDFKTPVIERSFLSSTVTVWSVSVLKSEKMSLKDVQISKLGASQI